MTPFDFPPLDLADWQPTRDTLRGYAQVLGKIRRALTPHQKHWWHVSLRTAVTGLTTTPIAGGGATFEMLLDLVGHQLITTTSRGEQRFQPLAGQSAAQFCADALADLDLLGVEPPVDCEQFEDGAGRYDRVAVGRYWEALRQVDVLFRQFRHSFRRESSPVQLWPHHFDLALLWFSGRLVPDQDPKDPEYADEQMNFGFSTGDEGTPDPYFYATAYPLPDGLLDAPLPAGATWHTEGWTGALLPYRSLVGVDAPEEKLLAFLRAFHEAGARLMR